MIDPAILNTYRVCIDIPGSQLIVYLPQRDVEFLYEEAQKRFEELQNRKIPCATDPHHEH